jgi:hypothetical protein
MSLSPFTTTSHGPSETMSVVSGGVGDGRTGGVT